MILFLVRTSTFQVFFENIIDHLLDPVFHVCDKKGKIEIICYTLLSQH